MYYHVLTLEENYMFFAAAVASSIKNHERRKLYAELLSGCEKDKVILAQCAFYGLKDPITYLIEDFVALCEIKERLEDDEDPMYMVRFCYGTEIFDSSD